MNEFLLEYKNTITFSVEVMAAVTGLFFYKKYKLTAAKYFIWFLIYLSVCDFLGSYVKYINKDDFLSFLKGTIFVRNFWWTTAYWEIGAVLFFAFYYSQILKTKVFKTIITYCALIFLVFSILYIIFHWDDYFTRFFPIISILGAVIIFLSTIFYFIETLLSNKILTFYKSINFYISVAIFIWWLILTPLVFYDIYNSYNDWNFIFLKWQIYLFANVIMYTTFTFALISCKPEKDNVLN
ncbi:hypothetical protein SAMN05428642_10439 [Flaviramulus basaltis]|uniref:Bacteriorhodopsin n=1 Tax=Flaviramulus basaltis TaxID=369401 RepID=A0A1K2IPU0_9FLAO|nr:hypothetical protein [Flaviramulus basaltis]SFZ94274.1 hypothetical protein SAMN05428642_10439 [Flaviramulus basaltis]